MSDHVESGYGFLFVHKNGRYWIDVYLPSSMLAEMQLVPGSTALVQGLDAIHPATIRVRASKGAEQRLMGKHPFIASIRLPNRPTVLRDFLSSANKRGVNFASIRTKGLRGPQESDVICEGAASSLEPTTATALKDELARDLAAGEVTSSSLLDFGDFEEGIVQTSRYLADVPGFRGPFNKIRLSTYGSKIGNPFKDLEERLLPVRVQLDARSMDLTVDLSFAALNHYVLRFKATDLQPGSNVTQTLLESLPPNLNVESVDAFEYREWDPRASPHQTGRLIRSTGTIEFLLTTEDPIDSEVLETQLIDKITKHRFSRGEPQVVVVEVARALRESKHESVPEDSNCRAFRKFLNDGRYAFVEQIDSGGYGVVGKYLDLNSGTLVAGKYFLQPDQFTESEVRALKLVAEKEKGSTHAAAIIDYFHDGTLPVIIMDLADNTLGNHVLNRWNAKAVKRHNRPGNFSEFIEMAVQLLRGLAWLHSGGIRKEVQLIHADVKPDNIGYVDLGTAIVWKLLDLGITRSLPAHVTEQKTVNVIGTPPFMSPQVLAGRKMISNDIYALGVVCFVVLNGWRHPSRADDRDVWKRFDTIAEVSDFVHYESGYSSTKPEGFGREQWRLEGPFADQILSKEAGNALADIIYDMIALDPTDRIPTAETAIARFEAWRDRYL